jgi:hypothetical protein
MPVTCFLFIGLLFFAGPPEQQVVNVADPKWGGVDPTGVRDSRPAFDSAMKSLVATNGGTVCFPSGTYMFDSYETSSAGDRFTGMVYSDNTTIELCPGAAPGSVTLFHGPHVPPYTFGPISVFNTAFFMTSRVGMNGYQNVTQNGGFHTLKSPLTAGATMAEFANPPEAANCPAGGWIAITTSTDPVVITPLEINQVIRSDARTGLVTLKWPQTISYPTYSGGTAGVYAACVSHMVRQHVKIDGLTLRAAAGVLLNDVFDFEMESSHIQCDATYIGKGKCNFLFANAVRHFVVRNNRFDHYPADSGPLPAVDLVDNNPIDLLIEGNTFDTVAGAGSEFVEHSIFRHNELVGGVFSGFDIQVSDNTFRAFPTSQPWAQIADNSTAPNPFHFPFAGTKFVNNKVYGVGGGTGLNTVFTLYQPDTELIGNTIFATKGEMAIATQQCCKGLQHNVISGNEIHCDAYKGPYACVFLGSTLSHGEVIAGNRLYGTNGTGRGIGVQTPPDVAGGVVTIFGNTQTGFAASPPLIDLTKARCAFIIHDGQFSLCTAPPGN